MHNTFYKKIFFLLILLIILVQPLEVIYQRRNVIFSDGYSQKYSLYKKLYENSQYAKKISPGIIPDEILESFAGGIFLKGINPILIIHDQPPLGRYIISASIAVYDNQTTIPFFLLIISCIGIFLLAWVVLGNATLALIPLGFFINQPIFLQKFQYIPLLEPIQLPFIFFALYFFIKSQKTKKYIYWFFLTSLMIGFVISIRFFILGTVLAGSMIVYLLLVRAYKKTVFFGMSLLVSLGVLLLSYAKTLQSGYSPMEIIGIQKYIFTYHVSKFVLPFTVWDLLLFNRWHTWWGSKSIMSDSAWTILWPISVLIIITFGMYFLWKKITITDPEKIIGLWTTAYMMMLSSGYTSTRYFLPLIPFLYILSFSFLVKAIKIYYKKNEK